MKPTKNPKQTSFNTIIFWGSLIILVALFYWWRSTVFNIFPFNYDEGIHLILGKLWAAGYTPYREIFVSYPPFFLWSLGFPWKIFNQVGALRLLMATYALGGVLAVIYLGKVYNSRLAGISAGVILSFTPTFFIPSFAIMTEVPSISLAVAAIALAEKYRRSGGWIWPLLTGLMLGFGLSLKILPYYAAPLIALMIISAHIGQSNIGQSNIGQSNIGQSTKKIISREKPRTKVSGLPPARSGVFLKKSRIELMIEKRFWPAKLVRPIPQLKQGGFPGFSRNLALLGVGFLITFLLPAFLFDFTPFYEQVISMRLASRVVENNPFKSNNLYIRNFLFGNPGVMALALYGFVFVVARKLSHYWIIVTWFILIWISMYFLVPLRSKHLPIFLPLISLFAAFGLNHSYIFLKQIKKEGLSARSVAMALTITLILVMFVENIPHLIAQNNGQTLAQKQTKRDKERSTAISFIDTIATPDDCVIADNPVFLYQTNRLPPPELSETSQTRIDTGYLTLQNVIESIQTHHCYVVAVVTPRFGESLPGLSDWLAKNYLGLHTQSETFIYFAPKGHLAQKEANLNHNPIQNGYFDQLAHLENVRLNQPPPPSFGQEKIYISLLWRLISPIETDYIEQIILRNPSNNQEVYRMKRLPFAGLFNPIKWHPTEQVRDTFRLELPPNLPRESYDIYLSLCFLETSECLSINNQAQTELYLTQFTLDP